MIPLISNLASCGRAAVVNFKHDLHHAGIEDSASPMCLGPLSTLLHTLPFLWLVGSCVAFIGQCLAVNHMCACLQPVRRYQVSTESEDAHGKDGSCN